MTRRIDLAVKQLNAVIKHTKHGFQGKLGGPRQVGKGNSVQLYAKNGMVYLIQDGQSASVGSLESLKSFPDNLKRSFELQARRLQAQNRY